MDRKLMAIIVCGAGPAGEVGHLVALAQQRNLDVRVVPTPAALKFLDTEALAQQTGMAVQSQHRGPGATRSRLADALVVAPATFNSINKIAAGIADSYALDLVAEGMGLDLPLVILPFVNTAFVKRAPFQRSVAALRAEGAQVLLGTGGFEPHAPRTGNSVFSTYPWHLACAAACAAIGHGS